MSYWAKKRKIEKTLRDMKAMLLSGMGTETSNKDDMSESSSYNTLVNTTTLVAADDTGMSDCSNSGNSVASDLNSTSDISNIDEMSDVENEDNVDDHTSSSNVLENEICLS